MGGGRSSCSGGARDGFGGSGFAVVGVAAPQNAETTGSDDLGGSGGGFRRGSGASPRTRPRGVAGGRSLAECGRADAPKAETAGSDAAGGVAARGGGGAPARPAAPAARARAAGRRADPGAAGDGTMVGRSRRTRVGGPAEAGSDVPTEEKWRARRDSSSDRRSRLSSTSADTRLSGGAPTE